MVSDDEDDESQYNEDSNFDEESEYDEETEFTGEETGLSDEEAYEEDFSEDFTALDEEEEVNDDELPDEESVTDLELEEKIAHHTERMHQANDDETVDEASTQPDEKLSQQQPSADSSEQMEAAAPVMAATPEARIAAVQQVPLNIVVEIGRLQISVQKLMELQPGNLIEVNVQPSDTVTLTSGGIPIAKGELLRLGDMLGIRIIEIG